MSIQDFIVQITNEAILITIMISMPGIVVSLFIGVAVAIFSATTQIQEQALSFVPKMIAVFAVISMTAGWAGTILLRFAERCLGGFVDVVR
jgi:flagellar biosynthetic protein FliQ